MPGSTTLFVIGLVAVAAVVGLLGAFAAVKQFYVVPEADEALIKTGGKKPVVSTGGGLWVIPMFHKVSRVTLQAIRVPIDRTGDNAVPSQDMIPAEIRGEMFVQIEGTREEDIKRAVQSLGTGDPNTMGSRVREKIDSQVTDALRTAAFKKTFIELNSQKKEFAEQVVELLQEDLAKLGLTLTAVSVTHVSQGPFTDDAGDVIAAQGRRNVAETVEKNRQETNRITREAEIEVQQQDVEAREKALELEYRQKQREADNRQQVDEYEATRAAETRKAVLAQEQATKLAEAEQMRAVREAEIAELKKVEAAEIEKERVIAIQRAHAEAARKIAEEEAAREREAAEIERQKAIEAAKIAKEQEIAVSSERRHRAIEEAEVERQVAVAQKREEEASARAKQAAAEAEQRKAEEAIVTVQAEAEADRRKRVVTISAQEEAEKDRIAADRDAYVEAKKAEGERDAAQKRAEARKAEAQGEADSQKIAAEGYASEVSIRAEAEFQAADKQASARRKLAEAELEEGRARAEARRLLLEADNAISRELVFRDVTLKLLDVAPAVVHEVMAPVANVAHDVKILQVHGLGGEDGDGVQGIPATVLQTGLAAAGVVPFLNEAMRALRSNPDVAELTGLLERAATSTLHETVQAAKGVAKPNPEPEA